MAIVMDNTNSSRRQISLFGLLGLVTAVAVVFGLARYLGLLIPILLISWYTALCFCRRMETLQFVFFGVPLLVVVGGGACFAILGILRALIGLI